MTDSVFEAVVESSQALGLCQVILSRFVGSGGHIIVIDLRIVQACPIFRNDTQFSHLVQTQSVSS